jgi:hypothetical protein
LRIAAAYLAAAGANNRRIAQTLGKSEAWVCYLTKQGFFQQRIASILKEKNRDALESMFKIQRFSNPMTLVELAGDPKKRW